MQQQQYWVFIELDNTNIETYDITVANHCILSVCMQMATQLHIAIYGSVNACSYNHLIDISYNCNVQLYITIYSQLPACCNDHAIQLVSYIIATGYLLCTLIDSYCIHICHHYRMHWWLTLWLTHVQPQLMVHNTHEGSITKNVCMGLCQLSKLQESNFLFNINTQLYQISLCMVFFKTIPSL